MPHLTGEIVLEYLDRFPTANNLTLAKKIYKENSEVFTSVESVRSSVRRYKGQQGVKHREKCTVKDHYAPSGDDRREQPFGLPPSDEEPYEPFLFPLTGKGLVISDTHIPYHNVGAITTTIQYALDTGATDFIIIAGDLMDHYQLSRFQKDPRKKNFKAEMDAGNQFLDVLQGQFDAPIYFRFGNHDERLENYLFCKAPELLDCEEFTLEHHLKLKDRGIVAIKNKQPIYVHKLNIVHGDEYGGSGSSVNPARGMFLKAHECTLSAHNHRTSMHSEPTLRGTLMTTWSLGCLCGLHPAFARLNKWNWGFTILDVDNNGFEVSNKRIVKGEVV